MAEKEIYKQSESSESLADRISIFGEKENMTMKSGKIVDNRSVDKAELF